MRLKRMYGATNQSRYVRGLSPKMIWVMRDIRDGKTPFVNAYLLHTMVRRGVVEKMNGAPVLTEAGLRELALALPELQLRF